MRVLSTWLAPLISQPKRGKELGCWPAYDEEEMGL
jgi:hypothetical protein